MKNKTRIQTTRFLWVSLSILLALCITIFTCITRYMLKQSDIAIKNIGQIYMSEINMQITRHFNSVIDLKLSQVEGITEVLPPETSVYGEEMTERLAYNAKVRGFSYLGLCGTDGSIETVYGEPVKEIQDHTAFVDSLNQDESMITSGQTDSGVSLLLFGISCSYPMDNGVTGTALIAGIPMDFINDTLSLGEDESLVYSHIIRLDGSYVLRNVAGDQSNYFDRLRKYAQFSSQTPEEGVKEMEDTLNQGKPFSKIVTIHGEKRHIYGTALPHSQWYLLSIMPYGVLDETISNLGYQRVVSTLAACVLMLASLLVIYFFYFRLTQSQLKSLEAAKNEAEFANKAKSEFLSNMSHDIRTPMNAIVGMTAIAISHLEDTEQVKECLRKITLSSKHLLGLINDVLDMSKIESGKLTLNMVPVSLKEILDTIVNIIQPQINSKDQHFNVIIQNILTEDVYCDGMRLNQVLLNLLSNAFKFTPEGGTIRFTLNEEESPKGSDYVRVHFRIKDTGIGMSPEFQKKIFEPFSRADTTRVQKTEGTGLGMAITKYIVDEMQGTIEVFSQLERGSEFHVTLDLKRADSSDEPMILPGWKMLVVDNDEDLCKSTVASLQEIGIRAQWVLSGAEAVALVEQSHDRHNDFDIVLLDWKMPGMDGPATAREIRKHIGDHVPILLMTAYDWNDIQEEAISCGISGFIPKPLFKSTLFYGLKPYVSPDVSMAETVAASREERSYSGYRVLLAEDNDLNWEIAEALLSELGLTLDHAENGQICLDMFRTSAPDHYDAILMDLRMPVMTGYEAAEAIRDLERPDAKTIPIIAMTADAFTEDIQKCFDCGMNAHIAKPIDLREMSRVLDKFLR